MVTEREAWIADKLRKGITLLVSAGGTWLLLRVLYRLGRGEQTLVDPELWLFVVLALAAVLWVRATRRMPRRTVGAETPSPADAAGSEANSPPDAPRSGREGDTPG